MWARKKTELSQEREGGRERDGERERDRHGKGGHSESEREKREHEKEERVAKLCVQVCASACASWCVCLGKKCRVISFFSGWGFCWLYSFFFCVCVRVWWCGGWGCAAV